MATTTSKKIILNPPVSVTYIKDPFTGNTVFDNIGKTFGVGTQEELKFFRVFVEGKDRDSVKLYFAGENDYYKWKNMRSFFK